MKELPTRRDIGKYFGYPKCCIEEFEKNRRKRPNKLQRETSKYQGFIPCISCCKLIMEDKIKIDNLIQNRECELPYPNENGKRIEYTMLCRRISRKNTRFKKITKYVVSTYEQDSVLCKIIVNKIIIRRANKKKWMKIKRMKKKKLLIKN